MICVSPLILAQNDESVLSNPIVVSTKNVCNAENIPNSELEKAYIAYRAAYNYGKLLDFEGCSDFGTLFDKMRLISERLKYVKNEKLSDHVYEILKKYEDKDFNGSKSDFLNDCYYISRGLEGAME